MALETDAIPQQTTNPSSWWSLGGWCSGGVKLDLIKQKQLRCLSVLMVLLGLIELGVGGAAADILMGKIGHQSIGMWWGALNPLIAGIVACFTTYEGRLWNLFVQSTIGALVAFVAAVTEGLAANVVSGIVAVGQITNSTGAAEYVRNVVPYKPNQAQGGHFMKLYGEPSTGPEVISCMKSSPWSPSALSFENDDSLTSPCYKWGPNCWSQPKFATNVCYFQAQGLGYSGCGSATLHPAPPGLPNPHNCGQLLTMLPDFAIGSTVLLSMLTVLSLLMAFYSGKWYYASLAHRQGLAAQDDSVFSATTGTNKNSV